MILSILPLAALLPLASAASALAPSDGEAAAAIKASNDAEIDAAQTALAKAQSDDVKTFAQEMLADLTESNQEVVSYVPGGGLYRGQAQSIADEAAQQKQLVSGLSGAAFDSAYAAARVQDLSALLEILDRALASSERRLPAFQELLQKTRAAAARHLRRARQLQAQLRGR